MAEKSNLQNKFESKIQNLQKKYEAQMEDLRKKSNQYKLQKEDKYKES